MMTVKEMFAEAQEMLDLNQKEFGVYVGVSTQTMNSWMTEKRVCPDYVAEMALRLARVDAQALKNGEQATGMMRWAVIDEIQNRDEYLTVCGSKAIALREAEIQWSHLTDREKKNRARFDVALIHVCLTDRNYDGSRFAYFEREDGSVDGDVYEVAKNWLQSAADEQ